jgi:hypothetical protein
MNTSGDLQTAGRQPNFFLVGAPKAGTTSLYHYLGQHPQIYMSPIKEPHYLADEIRAENFTEELLAMRRGRQEPSGPVSTWRDYLTLFQGAGAQTAIGEASVCYLWSKTAPQNIAARFPEAKILMMLRNPAERAYSQYLHTLSLASRPISFRECLDAALVATSTRIGTLYPFLEFGFYSQQIERYLAVFPRPALGIYFYDDYRRNPPAVLEDMFRFLGVDPQFQPDLSKRHMLPRLSRSHALTKLVRAARKWKIAQKVAGPGIRNSLGRIVYRPGNHRMLHPADRARLVDLYRDDIRGLSALLDRDLRVWLVS